MKFCRSQYVIHPSRPTSWYWTRPGSLDIIGLIHKLVLISCSINISLIPQSRFQRNITDGDFEFLKFLSHDDLTARSQITCFVNYKHLNISEERKCLNLADTSSIRMSGLDSEMEKEIDDLRRRYHAKRF